MKAANPAGHSPPPLPARRKQAAQKALVAEDPRPASALVPVTHAEADHLPPARSPWTAVLNLSARAGQGLLAFRDALGGLSASGTIGAAGPWLSARAGLRELRSSVRGALVSVGWWLASAGAPRRERIQRQFEGKDFSAEVFRALLAERARHDEIAVEKAINPNTERDWYPSGETTLLLTWLGLQPADEQKALLELVPELPRRLREVLEHYVPPRPQDEPWARVGFDVLPVDLLGDRWLENQGPTGTSVAGRFVPPADKRPDPPSLAAFRPKEQADVCRLLGSLQGHGIEEGKGGIRTLANILVEQRIAPTTTWGHMNVCWGPLDMNLDPSMSAGRHGPYFVILDPGWVVKHDTGRGIPAAAHIAYIVPKRSDVERLKIALDQAVDLRMMHPFEADECARKLVCYEDVLTNPAKGLAGRLIAMAQAPGAALDLID